MTKKIKILFIISIIGHPRDSKRIKMLQDAGFYVESIGFKRKRSNNTGRNPECDIHILAQIQDRVYYDRIILILKNLPFIRNKIKNADIVYASGPDMAFMSLISKIGLKRPVILEIGDIQKTQTDNGVKGVIYRIVDKVIVNSCQLLVVTSKKYYEEYYNKWLQVEKDYIVLENKLETYQENENSLNIISDSYLQKENRKIRIGYFGVLRCNKTFEVLMLLAERNPENIEIVIAGQIFVNYIYIKKLKEYKNIKYKGEYKSPDDLQKLYGMIDIVWGCYPFPENNFWNWRWARTNRFYESCFYKKPIIGLYDSGDASDIIFYDIGILVKNEKNEEIVNDIEKITYNDYYKWLNNLYKVPENVYIYTDEVSILKEIIKSKIRERL